VKKRAYATPEAPCSKRWGEAPCRPINSYWIFSPDGQPRDARHTCTCGKRFRVEKLRVGYARAILERGSAGQTPSRHEPPAIEELWDEELVTTFGKVGVVPVGTPVLHSPTRWYTGSLEDLKAVTDRMLRTMETAHGIGLAANQIGADLRALAHDLPDCAPRILVNPVRVDASGAVHRSEGCLSLNVPGTHAKVARWQRVTVVADLVGGRRIVLEADEMLAKVLQHELDHLDGIEYVQRMDGETRDAIYGVLRAALVPVECLPPVGPEVDLDGELNS
jgi:peptide deformylase